MLNELSNKGFKTVNVYYPSLLKYTKSSRKVDKEESVKERLKMDGIINYNSDVLKIYGNDN